MTTPLRVGITGCGRIALNHATALTANPDVEIVACSDLDPAKAKELAERFDITHQYTDLATMLAEANLDALTVCSPHPAHEAAVISAAEAGVHVLCEKPIAVTLDEADRMIQACDTAGVTFGALFQRRFWSAAQDAHAAIADGQLGSPVFASMTLRLGRDADYFNADPWRGTWAADGGGVLINQAIHYIDLLQWCVGSEVVEVTGRMATLKHAEHIEVEDTVVATLRFASGALATLSAGTTYAPGLGTQVLITGDNGATVSITEFPEGEPAFNDIWTLPGETSYRQVHHTDIESDPPMRQIHEGLTPYHAMQINDFVAALRAGTAPAVTGRDARTALAIVLGVYESARTGQPVTLHHPH